MSMEYSLISDQHTSLVKFPKSTDSKIRTETMTG